jgi:hypothetical protein
MFRVIVAFVYSLGLSISFQVKDSNCSDIEDFLKFRDTYDISRQIGKIPVFHFNEERRQIAFNCTSLFEHKEEESCLVQPPTLEQLQENDRSFVNDLSMNNEIEVTSFHFVDPSCNRPKGSYKIWTREDLEAEAKKPCTCGQYQNGNCALAFAKYNSHIKGKRGIIVGSYLNWAEAAALKYGAKYITTIEYSRIFSTHRKLTITTPSDYAAAFLNKSQEARLKSRADFIISYSSLEHDGLGRYGDPLNAFGDLLSI